MIDILDLSESIGPVEVGVYNAGNAILRAAARNKNGRLRGGMTGRLPRGFIFGREVAGRMLPRGYGTIIYTGASAALRGKAAFAAFAAAKAGLRMVSQSRREFITLLGGAVAAWPFAASALQAPPPPPPPGEGGTFFVSAAGNDANDGHSEATPWRTRDKVNAGRYEPGTRIRFRSGDTFAGNIYANPTTVPGRGDSANPITFDTYFPVIGGPKAKLTHTESGETGIFDLDRVSGITIDNLMLWAENLPSPRGGVLLRNNSSQRMKGITVKNCDIGGIRYGESFGDIGGCVFIEGWPSEGGFEDILELNNNYHGLSGVTSNDDLGSGSFSGGAGIFNRIRRGCLVYHIGTNRMLPKISPTQQAFPPMGDGLDNNGDINPLSEFNVIHDNAANYVNAGAGPCALLTANTVGALWQFNEGYNIQPSSAIQVVDFVGGDFDNDTVGSTMQLNYFHDNYNSGAMLFSNGSSGWNNNTIRKNLCVNNCKSGLFGFGEITITIPGGNPVLHVDDNVTFNDRVYTGQPFRNLDQGSAGLAITQEGVFQGTVQRNVSVMSQDIYGFWTPVNARKNNAGWNPSATFSSNQWFGRNGGSLDFWWGNVQYFSLGDWQAASSKGPNIAVAGAGPNVFVTYQLALSAADRTLAAHALAAITTIPGIDIVGPRASALRPRLLAGDSPVTLPEFIALGFALTRMDTVASNALLDRIKAIVLAV